jgi:type VI secretion system ImpM family protein
VRLLDWAFGTRRRSIGAVAGFGKVPALDDFVRSPPRSDEMTAFEEWVTGAMQLGESRRGPAWKDDLAAAGTLAFLWGGSAAAKGRGLLAGVVKASHDSVGRAFPIVIGAPLPVSTFAVAPHLAPIALADFFREAAKAAANASHARSQAEFQLAVTAPRAPTLEDIAPAATTYATWTQSTRARAHFGATFGSEGPAQPEYAVHTIVDATHPFRGREAPPVSLGMRAPLRNPAETTAATWVDLVRSAAGWTGTVPTFFWPLGGDSILVQLGVEAPPSVLVDLWAPLAQSDAGCELRLTEGQAPRFVAPLPDGAAAALGDEGATLEGLLAGLAG